MFDGTAGHDAAIEIVQDVIDYDVIEQRQAPTRTYADVAFYPVSESFPTKSEILGLFELLAITGNCRVQFYFAGDENRTHAAAEVERAGKDKKPVVGLYPKAGAKPK